MTQRRKTSLKAKDEMRSQHATVEIRPSVVMTADRYKEWSASGQEGQRQIEAAYDQVVVDLVETYKIVGNDRARGLRDWLAVHIPYYFQMKLVLKRQLTKTQDDKCRKKIEKAGQVLLDEIPRLFNLEPATIADDVANGRFDRLPIKRQAAMDWLELKNFLSRTKNWDPKGGYATRKHNAAKPALKDLGDDLRCFWVTGWSSLLEDPKMPLLAPDITAGSRYVQFAMYIYAFVNEYCEEEGVISRLKDVEYYAAARPGENFEYQDIEDLLEHHYGQAGQKKQAQKNNA